MNRNKRVSFGGDWESGPYKGRPLWAVAGHETVRDTKTILLGLVGSSLASLACETRLGLACMLARAWSSTPSFVNEDWGRSLT